MSSDRAYLSKRAATYGQIKGGAGLGVMKVGACEVAAALGMPVCAG